MMKQVMADNGKQFFIPAQVEEIGSMCNDTFINEHRSLERRFSDRDVAEYFDISISEVQRIKEEYGVPNWL